MPASSATSSAPACQAQRRRPGHRRRDARLDGVLATGLPVWCAGVAAPASVNGLTFVDWQEPIGCGGIAIFPGDVIVADDDGAVVIPQAIWSSSSRMKAPSTSSTKAGCSARSKRASSCPASIRPTTTPRRAMRRGGTASTDGAMTMFFVLSKMLGFFAQPSNRHRRSGFSASCCWRRASRRAGGWLAVASVLGLIAVMGCRRSARR